MYLTKRILRVLVLSVSLVGFARAAVIIKPQDNSCPWQILVIKQSDDTSNSDFYAKGHAVLSKESAGWDYSNTGFEYGAAFELACLIEKMTGVKPEVIGVQSASLAEEFDNFIAIGRLARQLGAEPPKSTFGIDGNVVVIEENRILLAGETPIASYFAMTRLVEMAGCKWYMPGRLGEVIPHRNELVFKEGKYDEVPVVWSRHLWLTGGYQGASDEVREEFHQWMLHNRQYGVLVSAYHVWHMVLPAKKYFKDNPEWYAMIKGKRKPVMLCTSNEEMTAEFIKNYKTIIEKNPQKTWFSLSQDDGYDFCQCANCTMLDPGLNDVIMSNMPQITDRLVNFYNKVVAGLVEDYPDKYFCFLAYVNSTAPPVREKLHPHLMPQIAPILFSRYHAMNAHNSETMQALHGYIESWAVASKYIGYYGYAFNLADTILPYTREHQSLYDMPLMARHGLGNVCMETSVAWHNLLPYYYLIARMNLNSGLDTEAIIDRFYKDFFGPAAKDMKAYMDMLKDAYASLDYEVGGQWFAPLLFTPEFMKKANQFLTSAQVKAKDDKTISERIEMWRFGYKCAELVLQMRQQTNNFEFRKASDTGEEICTIAQEMLKKNPHTASPFALKYWFKQIYVDPLTKCADAVDRGTILYKFPDEWYAFVDYSSIGEIGRLYSPDFPLIRWMKLKTYSKTIGEQKLTRFRGTIWYRNTFTVDSNILANTIHIFFSGIDDTVVLYINGKKVGTKTGSYADFDITDCVQAGENTVVCAINNEGISELETGGIMRPVVLYIPNIPTN